jgi:hypothetical protein
MEEKRLVYPGAQGIDHLENMGIDGKIILRWLKRVKFV